jgi:hypothetical protein
MCLYLVPGMEDWSKFFKCYSVLLVKLSPLDVAVCDYLFYRLEIHFVLEQCS